MLRLAIAVLLMALASTEKVSYENYKVFRIIPSNQMQVEILNRLGNLESTRGFSFWRPPSRPKVPVDLMVPPDHLSNFYGLINTTKWKFDTYVENVQDLIDKENPTLSRSGDISSTFDWTRYHTLEEIYSWLDALAENNPDLIQIIHVGKSYQGRVIKGVKLSFGANKPGVFIEGGIHAREWISPATVTYLLNEFLTSQDPEVRKMAESYDWYIVPSLNPDGYVYTHTTDRAWRKTVSKSNSSRGCFGADPNRNWDFKWNVVGASSDPCSDTYAGKSALSEIEIRTASRYIKSISDKLFAYISFHCYSQLLMFPYGHTVAHLDNYAESYAIAEKTTKALAQRYGTKYEFGDIAETIYKASGSSLDWVKAKFRLPISFVYELRDTGRYGFLLPADQIIPNGQEVLDSFVELFKESKKFGYPKP